MDITPISLCGVPTEIIDVIFEYAGPVACVVRRHVCKRLNAKSVNYICAHKTEHTCSNTQPCIPHDVFCDDLACGTLETYLWAVINSYAVNIVNKVIKCGNVEIARVLIPIYALDKHAPAFVENICRSGQLGLVKWADQNFNPIGSSGLESAAYSDCIEVAEWIMTKSRKCPRFEPDQIQWIIRGLRPEMCDLITRYTPEWAVPASKIHNCFDDIVDWLIHHNRIKYIDDAEKNEMRRYFARGNATKTAKKLHDQGLIHYAKWLLE